MIQERAPIHTPQRQLEAVRGVVNLEKYLEFDRRYFSGQHDLFASYAEQSLSRPNRLHELPEYFQFLGLVSSSIAQMGVEKQEGMLLRRRWWGNLSIFSPRMQLALGSYVSGINEKAFPIRQEWERAVLEKDPDAAKGVWGIMMYVENGEIIDSVERGYNDSFVDTARRRMEGETPISMPNRELNGAFANLNFTPEDARSMSKEQFDSEIYPEVEIMLDGIIDASVVFETQRRRKLTFRFYSIPA